MNNNEGKGCFTFYLQKWRFSNLDCWYKTHVNYQYFVLYKVSNGAKIRNRYNQVPHPTQDTNGKVTNSQ